MSKRRSRSAEVESTRERVIAATEFKATCLAVLDEVDEEGVSVVVTKRGRPVARIIRVVDPVARPSLLGSVVAEHDLISPIGEAWNADR